MRTIKWILVKAHPNCRQEKFQELGFEPEQAILSCEVWTRALAEKNQANKDIIKILAKNLNVPCSVLEIKKGRSANNKVFKVYSG